MKANELMIDDWVCFLVEETAEDIVRWDDRVVSINNTTDEVSSKHGIINGIADLRPIRITAEILEKNGFKREEEERGFSEPYCVYVNDDFQYVVKVYPKDGMDRYSRLEIGEYDDSEHVSLLINHVHELQHAMRLAGINKEFTI